MAPQGLSQIWGPYAPNEFKIVAVAEPDPVKRNKFAQNHKIPENMRFNDWKDVFDHPIEADCVMVCTQDRMHYEPVLKALEKGYHVLCEKPMSPFKEEIIEMGEMAEKHKRLLVICHVLRYSDFFAKIKELLDKDKIGELVSIQQLESVGYWHQAHSFVRGNWNNSQQTSPMILQKSCHDMDILLWLVNSKCTNVHSFGSLKYFKEENAPEGAPKYCLDGCNHRDECPYYAPRFYLDHPKSKLDGFDKVVSLDTSREKIIEALKTGPYGRCVFHCNNNVVDHQVVNLEFENQVNVSFTMCAFTNECERVINLMGTKGQIQGNMEKGEIEIVDFVTGAKNKITLNTSATGHSGSDTNMMKDFVSLIASEGSKKAKTTAKMSVESHLIALAAESSRVNNKIIDMGTYTNS